MRLRPREAAGLAIDATPGLNVPPLSQLRFTPHAIEGLNVRDLISMCSQSLILLIPFALTYAFGREITNFVARHASDASDEEPDA